MAILLASSTAKSKGSIQAEAILDGQRNSFTTMGVPGRSAEAMRDLFNRHQSLIDAGCHADQSMHPRGPMRVAKKRSRAQKKNSLYHFHATRQFFG